MSVTPRRSPFQEWMKNCRPGPSTSGVVSANSSGFSLAQDGMKLSSGA